MLQNVRDTEHLIFRRNPSIPFGSLQGMTSWIGVNLADVLLRQMRESCYRAFCWLSSITFCGTGNCWQKSNGNKQLGESNFSSRRCPSSE